MEVFPHPDESRRVDLEAIVGDGEDCFFCPGTVDEAYAADIAERF